MIHEIDLHQKTYIRNIKKNRFAVPTTLPTNKPMARLECTLRIVIVPEMTTATNIIVTQKVENASAAGFDATMYAHIKQKPKASRRIKYHIPAINFR